MMRLEPYGRGSQVRDGQKAGASDLPVGTGVAAAGSEGRHVGERMRCSSTGQPICTAFHCRDTLTPKASRMLSIQGMSKYGNLVCLTGPVTRACILTLMGVCSEAACLYCATSW